MECKKLTTTKYLTRNSPPYHANDCKNKIMKGNDDKMYISKPDKNNIYKWILIKDDIKKDDIKKEEIEIKYKSNPDSYYKQFDDYKKPIHDYKKVLAIIPKLKAELKSLGITLYYLKWNEYATGYFQIEYFFEDNKIDKNYVLFTEKDIYLHSTEKDGYITAYHNINEKLVKQFNDILMKYFPKKTIGFTTRKDTIKIFYKEQKRFRHEKEKESVTINFIIKEHKDMIKYSTFIKSLENLPKSIGYMVEYDIDFPIAISKRIHTFVKFHIVYDKLKEFDEFLIKLKQKIPDIVSTYKF
jgi:hypothetical protein